jgi:5-methylcytosine-specific restriction endonuclease McrA
VRRTSGWRPSGGHAGDGSNAPLLVWATAAVLRPPAKTPPAPRSPIPRHAAREGARRLRKRRVGACVNCGKTEGPVAHHVMPAREGGLDVPANLVTLLSRLSRARAFEAKGPLSKRRRTQSKPP